MVTIAPAQRLTFPLASALVIVSGLSIASILLILPSAPLEWLIASSGFAVLFEAGGSSLTTMARVAVSLGLGGGLIGVAWLVFRSSGAVALLRRRDVHPDAPPRPPLFAARDLGTPFLQVRAPTNSLADLDPLDMTPIERPLPSDLSRPLAEFDPGAILRDPLPAADPVAPLVRVVEKAPRPALIDPGDRFETFELTPIERSPDQSAMSALCPKPVLVDATFDRARLSISDAVVAPETEATIHDLLARLERGIAGFAAERSSSVRPTPAAAMTAPVTTSPASLAGTLGDLRRLAAGGY